MKKFLLKVFVFFMPVLLVVAMFYRSGYDPLISNSISFDAKIIELRRLNLKQVDIMAIGSSICLNNLNSAVIKDSLAMSYYNFGAWGLQMGDLNNLIKSYVAVYKPQYVLLPSNFADFDLEENNSLPGNLFYCLNLAPVYFIKNYTNYKDIIERKELLAFYRKEVNNFGCLHYDQYGGVPLNITKHNLNKTRLEFIDHLVATFPNSHTIVAYQSLDDLAAFLAIKKIKLIFIQFPYAKRYTKVVQKRSVLSAHFLTCKKIIEKRGGIYLDFETNYCYPDSIFEDPLHFNAPGATLITQKIAVKLKQIIKNN